MFLHEYPKPDHNGKIEFLFFRLKLIEQLIRIPFQVDLDENGETSKIKKRAQFRKQFI